TGHARDVGSADVAAAGPADVAYANELGHDHAEGNGAKEVGGCEDQNQIRREIHWGVPSAVNGNECSVVYSAPVDFVLLSIRWNSVAICPPNGRSLEFAMSARKGPDNRGCCKRASVRCGRKGRVSRATPHGASTSSI